MIWGVRRFQHMLDNRACEKGNSQEICVVTVAPLSVKIPSAGKDCRGEYLTDRRRFWRLSVTAIGGNYLHWQNFTDRHHRTSTQHQVKLDGFAIAKTRFCRTLPKKSSPL
jgi:hypothetical protein